MLNNIVRVVIPVATAAVGAAGGYAYKWFNMAPSSGPVAQQVLLGGAQVALKEAVKTKKGMSITACSALAACGFAFLYFKRKKLRESCEEYVMQLREKLGMELEEKPSSSVMKPIYGESVRQGSSEQKMARPKCQVLVGQVEGSEFAIYGSAVRIWDTLVVPTHVLMDAASASGRVWIKGSQGTVCLKVEDFEELDTDLSVIKLTPVQFSSIGLPQSSIGEAIPDQGEFVSICGVQSKGTVGKLVHDMTTFGKVVYNGTTVNGYSGAPYMKGGQILGVHCWGGLVNGGYSASYIKVKIMSKERQRFESSEDWLVKVFKSKKLRRNDILIGPSGDEVLIRHNGQYHRLDGDVFMKARGMDYMEGVYDDSESTMIAESLRHSGESTSLSSPGASESWNQPGQLELLTRNIVTEMLKQSTLSSLKKMKQQLSSPDNSASTSGLLSQETPK